MIIGLYSDVLQRKGRAKATAWQQLREMALRKYTIRIIRQQCVASDILLASVILEALPPQDDAANEGNKFIVSKGIALCKPTNNILAFSHSLVRLWPSGNIIHVINVFLLREKHSSI